MILRFSHEPRPRAAARGRRPRAGPPGVVSASFFLNSDTGPFDAVARFPGGSGRRAPPVLDVPAGRPDRLGDFLCFVLLALLRDVSFWTVS
jgi:hypothetical protein